MKIKFTAEQIKQFHEDPLVLLRQNKPFVFFVIMFCLVFGVESIFHDVLSKLEVIHTSDNWAIMKYVLALCIAAGAFIVETLNIRRMAKYEQTLDPRGRGW